MFQRFTEKINLRKLIYKTVNSLYTKNKNMFQRLIFENHTPFLKTVKAFGKADARLWQRCIDFMLD